MVHFRHIFVHCMLFQSHLNFCANLFGNLNENSPYATHHHISNFKMTIVENYLLRYFDHHPQYYTQFAPLRDRNQPRLKSMSKVCNVSSQMSQRKKKSWKSYLPFGIPQIGVTIPQILSKLFVKGNGWPKAWKPEPSPKFSKFTKPDTQKVTVQ